MKKAIPLTGSSDGISDLDLKRFRAALRKQLLKVAQTHPVASTRALFQKMADGKIGPQPKLGAGRILAQDEPEPPPAPVVQAHPSRRAPPPRPAFYRPSPSK